MIMRYLIILLFSISTFAQIPSAVGNGSTDDSVALQAWLDSGSSALPVGNEVYRITEQLEIDQSGAQTVDFNGATIIVTSSLAIYAIEIDKPDNAITIIQNLNVDGDGKLRNGVRVKSQIDANDVDIKDLYYNNGSVIAWSVSLDSSSHGSFSWDGCNVYNVESVGAIVADPTGKGSARAYDFQWTGSPIKTTVLIENFIWDGTFGSDGGPLRMDDHTGQNTAAIGHQTILRNGVNKNFCRRGMKIAMDNVTVDNVSFEYISSSHPKWSTFVEAAGLVGVRPVDSTPIENIIFNSCTFESTTYQWAIIDKMNDVTFSNCTFNNGAGIRIDNMPDSYMGDWTICNTTFSATSQIIDQNISSGTGSGQLSGTTLTYDTGNSRSASSVIIFNNANAASAYTYGETAVDCASGTTPDPDPTPQPNRIKALRRLTHLLING